MLELKMLIDYFPKFHQNQKIGALNIFRLSPIFSGKFADSSIPRRGYNFFSKILTESREDIFKRISFESYGDEDKDKKT